MIRRLRKTLRVSLQCHRDATGGSKACSSSCSESASSGRVTAFGGDSGSAAHKFKSLGVNFETESSKEADIEEPGIPGGELKSLVASRLGNKRC